MFIPSSGICENDNHDKIDNIWICLNKNCKQYPIFCSQCQKQLHNNHLGDCKDVQKFYTQINQQFKESLQEEVKIRKVYKAITSTYQKEIYNLQKIIDLLDQKNYQQINQYTNYNQNKSCLQYNPLLSAVEFFEEIEKTLKKNNNPVSTSDIYFEEQLCNDYQHKAEQLFKEGLNLWDQQQFTEALNCFNQSIQLNPCNYSIYAWKGRTLNKLQRYQEAKEACDIAINKDPLNDLAYSSKGKNAKQIACALIKLTQFDQVIEYCDKAIQLNNNNDAAYNNKAIALGYYGRTDEQLQCYEQAIKVNKRNEQLYINKGFLLLKLKKFQESVDCCEEIIKFNSQFVEAYNLKGVALFELKKYDEAIQSFEKMHSISKCPRSLVAKADVLLNQGQKLQAKQIYVQALNSGFKDQGYLESKIKLI